MQCPSIHKETVMRKKIGLVALLIVAGLALTCVMAQNPRSSPADELAIRKLVAAYSMAFNKGDLDGLLSHWAADADYVDDSGKSYKGRNALVALFKEQLAKLKGYKLNCHVTSLRVLSPDVALKDGTAELTSPEGIAESCRYTAVLVKMSDKWLISSVRDLPNGSDEEGNSAASQLKQLEWVVGEWVHEGKTVAVHVSSRWAMNKNFLIQEYAVRSRDKEELSVTQWIGWDPIKGQPKSWFFDSRGGHGDGLWAREGNSWVVETAGVLGDGRRGSSVNRWHFIDDKTYIWQSQERQIDGQPVPDVELKFLRRPAKR